MHTTLIIAAAVLMIPGIFMPIVPMLPALPYIFAIAIGFGFIDGFTTLSLNELLILGIFVVVSIIVDQLAGIVGAKYGGAHGKSLLWGIAGAILGLFMFPPFGALIGLFAAVFAAEIYYMKTHRQALKAASGALLGAAVGIAINIALALAFIGTFIFFVRG